MSTGFLEELSKRSYDIIDYPITFATWFAKRSGDSILSHSVTPDTGITKVSDSIDGFIITPIISGGTSGTKYKIVIDITTTLGLAKQVYFTLSVDDT